MKLRGENMNYTQFKAYLLSVGIGIFTFKLDSIEYRLTRTIIINRGQVTRGEGYSFEYLNNKIHFCNEVNFVNDVTFDGKTFEEVFPLLEDIYINEMTEEEFIRMYSNLDYELLDNIAEFNLGNHERFDSMKECLLKNEKEGNLLLLAGDSELDNLDLNKPSNYFIHYMGRVIRIYIDEMEQRISFLDADDKRMYLHYKYGRIKDHFTDQKIDNERYKDLQTLLKYTYSKKWLFYFISFIILFVSSIALIVNKLYLFAIISFVLCILIIVFGSMKSKKVNKHISQLKSRLYKQIPYSFSKYQNEFLNDSCEGFIDVLEAKYGKCKGGTPSIEEDTVDLLLYFSKFTICIYYMLSHAELYVEDTNETELINKKYRYVDFDNVDNIEANMLNDIINVLDSRFHSSVKK